MSKAITTHANLAAALNVANLQYPANIQQELIDAAKANRLVIIFGASDDLMEFRGAVYDEIGAWEGTTAYLNGNGLLENECENDECPHFAKLKETASTVRAIWSDTGTPCWTYQTGIPHSEFNIHEDGGLYCRGIVLCLDDVK